MTDSCQHQTLAGSLESPPEYCENDAVDDGLCEEHAGPDPDYLRDLLIDQQMEER